MLLKIILFIFVFKSQASEQSLNTRLTVKKSFLGFGYEFSQFKAEKGSISGSGGRINFLHAFNDSFVAHVFLGASLNQQGNVQNSFTNVGGILFYSIYGQVTTKDREIYIDEQLVLKEKVQPTSLWLVGGGLSQFFFNGNEGVYSASGLNVATSFQTHFFKIKWELLLKYHLLSSGATTLNGPSASIGINIPL